LGIACGDSLRGCLTKESLALTIRNVFSGCSPLCKAERGCQGFGHDRGEFMM